MQDYVNRLLTAINNYNSDDLQSVNTLRDLVCWISDNESLKNDKVIAELLFIASQKMRVFGYNLLNKYTEEPIPAHGELGSIQGQAVMDLYRSKANPNNVLDKSQQEVIDRFQGLSVRRLLVSAPTSYGKTFLMREIVFLNKDRYKNILLVFPTVALLLENAKTMQKFVADNNLEYQIVKTVDFEIDTETKNIFVFTPERALQLIAAFPELKIDFFFFDEVYKIDEDYCTDELDDEENNEESSGKSHSKLSTDAQNFLNEDRGKTFRIALYLLSKSVGEFYLAGPNLNQDRFGKGMQRFLELNQITVQEIQFEPTLRISVNAFNSKIQEKLPSSLPNPQNTNLIPLDQKKNDRISNVISYIDNQKYGKTLLYCKSPKKAVEYSIQLSSKLYNTDVFESYPADFKKFIEHIQKEYDIEHSSDEWGLIKVLKNGCGMHHGKLPKYIQQEILDQFNNGTFEILFCTSTIVEGVNTDAQNMIILNPYKGQTKLTPFDIKNIKGRAGRYYHCFIGRVFYMSKEIQTIENSDTLSLDFVTYSDKKMSIIDLDNSEIQDLTLVNIQRKLEREAVTKNFVLPHKVFIKNRTVSKENQEKLLSTLMKDKEFSIYANWITYTVDVESFLSYRWIGKILNTFYVAGLIDEITKKKFSAIANSYYEGGFKALLGYEIGQYKNGKHKTMDDAYSAAFRSLRETLEHKIPKILSLFESIITFIAQEKGINVDGFSLNRVRRYYETGVMTLLGEALIEYGFPVDAIRRIEEHNNDLKNMTISEAKVYCRSHFHDIQSLLDSYENTLFIRIMKSL